MATTYKSYMHFPLTQGITSRAKHLQDATEEPMSIHITPTTTKPVLFLEIASVNINNFKTTIRPLTELE